MAHSQFPAADQPRLRQHRLREILTVVALSAAFLFVGAIALGLLV